MSATGRFCRACLLIRYGEALEDALKNKSWLCPHCVEVGTSPAFFVKVHKRDLAVPRQNGVPYNMSMERGLLPTCT